jgi:hypothetical protein
LPDLDVYSPWFDASAVNISSNANRTIMLIVRLTAVPTLAPAVISLTALATCMQESLKVLVKVLMEALMEVLLCFYTFMPKDRIAIALWTHTPSPFFLFSSKKNQQLQGQSINCERPTTTGLPTPWASTEDS